MEVRWYNGCIQISEVSPCQHCHEISLSSLSETKMVCTWVKRRSSAFATARGALDALMNNIRLRYRKVNVYIYDFHESLKRRLPDE
jgi:hypothetical protein